MSNKGSRWQKLGLLFAPCEVSDWMHSHASYPTAHQIDEHLFRIFFSTRDREKRSSITTCVIDMRNPSSISQLDDKPLLSRGTTGCFDDCGVSMGSIVSHDAGDLYLYYLGWNIPAETPSVPYQNSIGLAIKTGQQEFQKVSLAPIIDRDAEDPITVSYPWVMKEPNKWRMWYGSHLSWKEGRFEMIHLLKYAESSDGIKWTKHGSVLPLRLDEGEFAISRPCVIRHRGKYKMWFSARGEQYYMGFAESEDGVTWHRIDALTISPSSDGWDSESVEYASIFEYNDRLFMLYNGNGYGKSGFGMAVLDD